MELDGMLKKDHAHEKNWYSNCKMLWFHSSMNRKTSVARLEKKDYLRKNGSFLVRNNYLHPTDFVLSFTYDKNIAHYRITSPRPLHYSIESGDVFKGLEKLIDHHRNHAGTLPTVLGKEAKGGEVAPPLSLSTGYSNCLHEALRKGDEDLAKKLIEHRNCPHLDAKNDKGSTALHLAVAKGMDAIVLQLIDKKATVEVPDADGHSPLFRAVKHNHPTIAKYLITEGEANVQLRDQESGNVPLHEAAKRGYLECIKVLLAHGAPVWTKNTEQKTPYELAVQYSQHQCAQFLDDYQPVPASLREEDWLHESIERREALELLEKHGIKDGIFLVRKSSRHPGCYVLTTCFNNKAYHYEINKVGNASGRAYYMDNGPLFSSLPHLVEYYCRFADGIEGKLTQALGPCGDKVKGIICSRKMEAQFMSQHMKPKVLESGATEYTLASGMQRTASTSSAQSTDSSDYQLTAFQRPDSVFDKILEGHILHRDSIELGTMVVSAQETVSNNKKTTGLISAKFSPGGMEVHLTEKGYELGQGEFGSVVKGVFKQDGKEVDVAIKTLRDEYTSSGKDTFLAEAKVMVTLFHPCIAKLVGVCEGPPLMLVQELVNLGSLLDFLLDYPEKISTQTDFPLWAAQIASGMLYLERKKFVHRDLAARNILVQSKEQVKVGDFGLSRAVSAGEEVYKASKGGRWPVRWYAPESVNHGKFSSLTDVWSFGVTLWEMYSFGDQPYEDKSGAEVMAFIDQGHRLVRPAQCPQNIYKTMTRCWRYDPAQRINFKKLLDFFNGECDTSKMDLPDLIYVQSTC